MRSLRDVADSTTNPSATRARDLSRPVRGGRRESEALPPLMSLTQAAAYLGKSRDWFRAREREGLFDAARYELGRQRRLFRLSELRRIKFGDRASPE